MAINFDLNDLLAFRAVAELSNFRKAAEAVHLSQPAFSRRIDKLEQALGVRLLTRTTRQLRLTEAGSHFYDDIAPLFERLREVHADTTAASETVSGTLRIAAPSRKWRCQSSGRRMERIVWSVMASL